MTMDRETIAQRMRTKVPRCLAPFLVTRADRPEPWVGDDIAVWRIACNCGGSYGSFLGYPLSQYNTKYSGSNFVGPLAFQCRKCNQVSELFDTNKHGYHAEACASPSKIYGEGPRQAFICPLCAGKSFEMLTSFFFWPASIDLVEDEPVEFESRAQDLFCEFVAHGGCEGCGKVVRFTDFGKL
jgi:hypothetical protein